MPAGIGVPRAELRPPGDAKDLPESWGINAGMDARTRLLSAGSPSAPALGAVPARGDTSPPHRPPGKSRFTLSGCAGVTNGGAWGGATGPGEEEDGLPKSLVRVAAAEPGRIPAHPTPARSRISTRHLPGCAPRAPSRQTTSHAAQAPDGPYPGDVGHPVNRHLLLAVQPFAVLDSPAKERWHEPSAPAVAAAATPVSPPPCQRHRRHASVAPAPTRGGTPRLGSLPIPTTGPPGLP